MNHKAIFIFAASVAVGAAGLMMQVGNAHSADTIGVHFTNGSMTDLNATVVDVTSGQSDPILKNERINAGGRTDKDVVKDSSGNGSVTWTSQMSDGKCKSGSKSGFGVGSEIDVSSGSNC